MCYMHMCCMHVGIVYMCVCVGVCCYFYTCVCVCVHVYVCVCVCMSASAEEGHVKCFPQSSSSAHKTNAFVVLI